MLDVLRFAVANPSSGWQECLSYVDLLELVPKRKTILLGVSKRFFRALCFSLPPPILRFGSSPCFSRSVLAGANTQNGKRATSSCANSQQWIVNAGKKCS